MRTLMSQGHIRVDETMIPIVAIWLERETVVVQGVIGGPLKPASGFPRVFSPNGEPVTDFVRGEWLDMPKIPAGDSFVATVRLHVSRDPKASD